MWQLAQHAGWFVNGIATAPSAIAPATITSAMVALDVQLMLRRSASQREVFHDECGYAGHVVEIEQRDLQVDRLIRHHGQQAFGGDWNFTDLIANDDDFGISTLRQ